MYLLRSTSQAASLHTRCLPRITRGAIACRTKNERSATEHPRCLLSPLASVPPAASTRLLSPHRDVLSNHTGRFDCTQHHLCISYTQHTKWPRSSRRRRRRRTRRRRRERRRSVPSTAPTPPLRRSARPAPPTRRHGVRSTPSPCARTARSSRPLASATAACRPTC